MKKDHMHARGDMTSQRPRLLRSDRSAWAGVRPAQRLALRGVIDVRNLRLRTFIGFNPEERVKQQDVVINVRIEHVLHPGVFQDQVDDALDYKRITKRIIEHVENGHFLLLEKLAGDVLAICSHYPNVIHVQVCIDKPHALRFADSVSLTLEHHVGDAAGTSEHVQ